MPGSSFANTRKWVKNYFKIIRPPYERGSSVLTSVPKVSLIYHTVNCHGNDHVTCMAKNSM